MAKPKSWRTTAGGVTALIVLVASTLQAILAGEPVEWGVVVPGVSTSLALIFARDQKAHDKGDKGKEDAG